MMRDILLRAATRDLQSVHTALAEAFLAPGRRRDFLFSPTPLPGGNFGAWVRINDPAETRGREVVVPEVGAESDFILRAFAAGKGPDGKKRGFPAAPKFDAARTKWLERQGGAHGFAVVRATFTVEGATVRRPAGIFGFNVTIFAGRLKVADAVKFQTALQNGIGTRRGYGCGMLIPLPDGGANSESNHPTRPNQPDKRRTP